MESKEEGLIMSEEELKPCLKCNKKVELFTGDCYGVWCKCGLQFFVDEDEIFERLDDFSDEEQAIKDEIIKQWNTRPTIWRDPKKELPEESSKIIFHWKGYTEMGLFYKGEFYNSQDMRKRKPIRPDGLNISLEHIKKWAYEKDILNS